MNFHFQNLASFPFKRNFMSFLQVNCAGILELGSIETSSLEQYDRMFNINVR